MLYALLSTWSILLRIFSILETNWQTVVDNLTPMDDKLLVFPSVESVLFGSSHKFYIIVSNLYTIINKLFIKKLFLLIVSKVDKTQKYGIFVESPVVSTA